MGGEPVDPGADGGAGDHERGLLGLAGPSTAAAGLSDREEGQDRPRLPRLVAVIEVVGAWIVEVDGLLHEPQAQNLPVEIEVALGRTGEGRDVVDPVCGHDRVSSAVPSRRRSL